VPVSTSRRPVRATKPSARPEHSGALRRSGSHGSASPPPRQSAAHLPVAKTALPPDRTLEPISIFVWSADRPPRPCVAGAEGLGKAALLPNLFFRRRKVAGENLILRWVLICYAPIRRSGAGGKNGIRAVRSSGSIVTECTTNPTASENGSDSPPGFRRSWALRRTRPLPRPAGCPGSRHAR